MQPYSDSPSVYIVSLGCPKNLVDTEHVMADLVRKGLRIVTNVDEADAVIVNTCGFLQSAEEESYETIAEFCDLRRNGDLAALVVCGCLVSRRGDDLDKEEPFDVVDAWLTVKQFSEAADAVLRLLLPPVQLVHSVHSLPPAKAADYAGLLVGSRLLATPKHTAYLRIADGCDNRCSYCVIPQIRGEFLSKPLEEVLREAESLADSGAVELSLIAQDTTRYGMDLYGQPKLVELLERLATIEKIRWVRIMYAHPALITDPLIDVLASGRNMCRYLDMPVQHTSDSVLSAMRRRVSSADLERIVASLRDRVPGIVLRTTVMVGFPGETKHDFQNLLSFLKNNPFDHVGVFPYSREEETPAFDMQPQISEKVIRTRLDKLKEEIEYQCEERKSHKLGETVEVLIDGACPGEENWFHGRWEGQAPDIDGHVYVKGESLSSGQFVPVFLTHLAGADFTGVVSGGFQPEMNIL